ncbi:hypothetical protein K2P97_09460 [bacterium]|nr:hypothetical protein [bacterium]
MKYFKLFSIIGFFILFQACATVKQGYQDTIAPSALDGAWLNLNCKCAGEDVIPSADFQVGMTLFINGNLILQTQMSRWKKTEWSRYCTSHQEATISRVSENIFEINTISDRIFSPANTGCKTVGPVASKRIWKILSLDKAELKFSSPNGCEAEPMVCTYKRFEN